MHTARVTQGNDARTGCPLILAAPMRTLICRLHWCPVLPGSARPLTTHRTASQAALTSRTLARRPSYGKNVLLLPHNASRSCASFPSGNLDAVLPATILLHCFHVSPSWGRIGSPLLSREFRCWLHGRVTSPVGHSSEGTCSLLHCNEWEANIRLVGVLIG